MRVIQNANTGRMEDSHGECTATDPASSYRSEDRRRSGYTLPCLFRVQFCGMDDFRDLPNARGFGRQRRDRAARAWSSRGCQNVSTAAESVSGVEVLYLYHCCWSAAASASSADVDRNPPAYFFPGSPDPDPDRYDGSCTAAVIGIVCAYNRCDDCSMSTLPALDASLKKLASFPVRSPYGAWSRQNSVVPPVWMLRAR